MENTDHHLIRVIISTDDLREALNVIDSAFADRPDVAHREEIVTKDSANRIFGWHTSNRFDVTILMSKRDAALAKLMWLQEAP